MEVMMDFNGVVLGMMMVWLLVFGKMNIGVLLFLLLMLIVI